MLNRQKCLHVKSMSIFKVVFVFSVSHKAVGIQGFSVCFVRESAQIIMATRLTAVLCIVTLCLSGVSAGQYNYNLLLDYSIRFYEAQRSGKLPITNRILYRGNSALEDKGNQGQDLTGGWYDAGDHVKFGFPMAFSATTLAWGILEFRAAYEAAGQYQNALDSIRWPLDYFIKAHVSDNEFYGQVGDGYVDHGYWGRPEDMTMKRPAWSITPSAPGSDLAAETAAAFAASYLVFLDSNKTYANILLNHAERLYAFAYSNRGYYSDSITNAEDFYKSSGYDDELAWGASWLYRATKKQNYLDQALEFNSPDTISTFSWDTKNIGYKLLLFASTGQTAFKTDVESVVQNWIYNQDRTPEGLVMVDGKHELGLTANAAFIALVAAKNNILATEARQFATQQIHYMLGDNGRSYVVGFGNNPPQQPQHRAASCPIRPFSCTWKEFDRQAPNYQILFGALVGGPDSEDSYEDLRGNTIGNRVSTADNAGFQGAVAGLRAFQLKDGGIISLVVGK